MHYFSCDFLVVVFNDSGLKVFVVFGIYYFFDGLLYYFIDFD